jgi:hypothetical protein
MSTAIEICADALANLGINDTVTSITAPTTKAERALTRVYTKCKRKLLGKSDWQFARRYAVLDGDTLPPGVPYSYAYALPNDVIKVRRVNPQRLILGSTRSKFMQALDEDGTAKFLYCDDPPTAGEYPIIEYTALVDESLFDQEFEDALAWEIAARVAVELRADAKLATLAIRMAEAVLSTAMATDLNENEPDAAADADYIKDRG